MTRKRLAGVRSAQRASTESYTPEGNGRTYAELARRSTAAVERSGGAIIHATFRHLADREAFTSALGVGAPLLYLECHAPGGRFLVERAGRRDRDPDRISDADAAVVRRELERWASRDEVPASAHLALRTDRPLEQIVEDVLALLDRRLFCLTVGVPVVLRSRATGRRGWPGERRRVA